MSSYLRQAAQLGSHPERLLTFVFWLLVIGGLLEVAKFIVGANN